MAIALPCEEDPELFFSEQPDEVELAKSFCKVCPARKPCLAGALERSEEWGVWGGELIIRGTIVPKKLRRGRPRRSAEVEQAAAVSLLAVIQANANPELGCWTASKDQIDKAFGDLGLPALNYPLFNRALDLLENTRLEIQPGKPRTYAILASAPADAPQAAGF